MKLREPMGCSIKIIENGEYTLRDILVYDSFLYKEAENF